MARARSFPSDFLKDPDIIALSGADECLILIGLILRADDYGRGFAHSTLLGREIRGYSPEQIESALHVLEALELVTLYEVGRHRYYSLPRWNEWQKLRDPAKSKFPVPPNDPEAEKHISQKSAKKGEEPAGNFAKGQNPAPEEEEEGEGEEEKEVEREKEKEEEEEATPPNVVAFPTAHTSTTSTASLSVSHFEEVTTKIAVILKLTTDEALKRIVTDYCHDATLSLFGEADAAREWIDDPRRNRKGQRMTPAFFRRWLKREHEDVLKRQATGTTGPVFHAPPRGQEVVRGTPAADPYAEFLARRTREVTSVSTAEQGDVGQ